MPGGLTNDFTVENEGIDTVLSDTYLYDAAGDYYYQEVGSVDSDYWTLKKDLSNETPAQTDIYSLIFDSQNNRIIAGTYPDAQLWVSADGGDTWTLKKDLSNETPAQSAVRDLIFDSQNNRIIAGTNLNAQLWVSLRIGEI